MLYYLNELNKRNIKKSNIFSEDDLSLIRMLSVYEIGIVDEKYYKKGLVHFDNFDLEVLVSKNNNKSNEKPVVKIENALVKIEKHSNNLGEDFKNLFFNSIDEYSRY